MSELIKEEQYRELLTEGQKILLYKVLPELNKYLKYSYQSAKQSGTPDYRTEGAANEIALALALYKRINKWVKFEDKEPDEHKEYLVKLNNKADTDYDVMRYIKETKEWTIQDCGYGHIEYPAKNTFYKELQEV